MFILKKFFFHFCIVFIISFSVIHFSLIFPSLYNLIFSFSLLQGWVWRMQLSCPIEWVNCLPCPHACVWLRIVIQKEDIINWQDLVPSDYHLFSSMKEGFRSKHFARNEKMKTAVMKWPKEQSTELNEAEIHALISRWNIAIEKNGDYVEEKGGDPQSIRFLLMYDTCSCMGKYFCTKEKGILWLLLIYIFK